MTDDLSHWASEAIARAVTLLGAVHIRAKLSLPAHSRASHVVDVDGRRGIGQFIVWPDGAIEATILNIETEQSVYFESARVADLADLDARFRAFLHACADAEKPNS